MRRLVVPGVCVALALFLGWFGYARSAPVVNTWGDVRSYIIFSDTLGHTASDSTSKTSLAVPSLGARFIQLVATSTASDSVALPLLQTHLPNGGWNSSGGVLFQPFSTLDVNPPAQVGTLFSATTPVTAAGLGIWAADSEPTIAGSYGIPCLNDSLRWKLKANINMLRKYTNSAGVATAGGSTGTITVRAFLWY